MIPIPILALLLAAQAEPVRIEVTWDGTTCGYRIDGAQISREDLERRAPPWGREGRTVALLGNPDTPYRCIGGAIYNLQLAGVEKVDFVSEPPSETVHLFVPAGRCRAIVNGTTMTLKALRAGAAVWKRTQPAIAFEVDVNARYECVDRLLAIVKEAAVTRLGFVGNEEDVPDQDAPKP